MFVARSRGGRIPFYVSALVLGCSGGPHASTFTPGGEGEGGAAGDAVTGSGGSTLGAGGSLIGQGGASLLDDASSPGNSACVNLQCQQTSCTQGDCRQQACTDGK